MPRIAVLTIGLGNGHNAAAKALFETAQENSPRDIVQIFDIGNYLNFSIRIFLISGYNIMTLYFPQVWKLLYQSAATKPGYQISAKIISTIAFLNRKKLITALLKFSPDQIIATHFFAPYFLNHSQLQKIPLTMAITDYGWHKMWYHPNNTHYHVASPEIAQTLLENYSIEKHHITLSGIPVSPHLYKNSNSAATKIKHNLPPDKLVILILTSGNGIMNPTVFIPQLWKIPNASIIVITGKNQRMYKKISDLKWPEENPHAILGWTENLPDYLHAAAVVITKPGGLITSECLAIGKPMILISPIPGQEEANAKYLTKIGAARFINSPEELIKQVNDYLNE